jgi:hypothetical protein
MSYYGKIEDSEDAILLIEACRLGRIHNAGRRLSSHERDHSIRSGAIFVWREGSSIDEVSRWTDGRRWEKSRIQGAFLVYNERPSDRNTSHRIANQAPLTKKAVTLNLKNNERYHLIAYYRQEDLPDLVSPRADNFLNDIQVQRSLYPRMTRNEIYGKNSKMRRADTNSSLPDTNSASDLNAATSGLVVFSEKLVSPTHETASALLGGSRRIEADKYIRSLEHSLDSCMELVDTTRDHSNSNASANYTIRKPIEKSETAASAKQLRRTDINFLLN